jgi:RimJ/RimL family protein N-acetyltransferase
MSKYVEPIAWPDHLKWLTARLTREAPNLFIGEIDGEPVGTFRVDGDEISYTVAPEARRRGVGSALLSKAEERFGALRAEIFKRNTASIKVAKRSGMMVHILD